MNRLTKSRPITEYEAMNLSLTDLYMRLKAYEDTGLEPEQIRELLHDSTGPLHKKLGEWIDAGQEGRLLVLPCKVGDELWIKRNGKIQCETIDRISVDQTDEDDDWYISIYTMTVSVLLEDIGRLVFLTREDAEKALEGMKK